MAAGKSFCSVSDEVFTAEGYDLSRWCAVDLLFGEEKTTASAFWPDRSDFRIYTPEFIRALERMRDASVPVFMSGSYPGTDLMMAADTALASKVKKLLHFTLRTGHAVRTGGVAATDIGAPEFTGKIDFNAGISDKIYAAEAPDAIEPSGRQSFTAFRYRENNTSAAVMYRGEVKSFVMGFPFETILLQEERDALMKQILDFLLKK
jgi:hypothetical protein